MKTLLSIAAALAAFTSTSAALASDTPASGGHYEWRSQPQFGPRAPLRAAVRVWVGDTQTVASCDCAMMHETAMAADCMAMPHKGTGPTNG